MRYLEAENPYIICRFTTGDTVTINIYDLSDDSLVVNGASMSEIGSTGYFKYQFNPDVTTLKEYLYVATNGVEEHGGKIILGGYPDEIKDQTDKLQFAAGNDVKATLDGEKVALTDATEAQIDAIEADTNEMQGKLPDDDIAGSSDKTSLESKHGTGSWEGTTPVDVAIAVLEELIADHQHVSGSLADFIRDIKEYVDDLETNLIPPKAKF